MSHPRRIAGVAPVIAALTLLCASALGQVSPISCFANAGVPPTVRAEGRTELTGDLILECSGLKQALPANLTLTLNTAVTSKSLGAKSEALLLLNEPKQIRESGPGAPLTPGSNVFQGVVAGNTVTFSNVTLRPPQDGANMVIRFTNVRADASQLGPSATLIPTQIMALVTASAPAMLIENPSQTVGYIYSELKPSLIGAGANGAGRTSLPVCVANNAALLSNPSASGGIADMILRFEQGPRDFALTAFRPRIQETQEHSVPGQIFNSESGFVDISLPTADRMNEAGLASSGTRLVARFKNVPAGMAIYVSTASVDPLRGMSATLIRTDAAGGGPATPVAATTAVVRHGVPVPVAPVPLTNGTGMAVWEVDSAPRWDYFESQMPRLDFVVVAAYNAGTIQPGMIPIETGLAPFHEDASWVPRFIQPPPPSFALALHGCDGGLPDLVPVLRIPSHIYGGQTVQYGATLYNNSASPAAPFDSKFEVLSSDGSTVLYSANRRIESGVPAWSSLDLIHLVPVDASLTPPLAYSVRLTLDTANAVSESNEGNNQTSEYLWVQCGAAATVPGLVVSPAGGTYPLPLKSGCPLTPALSATWASIAGGYVTVAPNTTYETRTAYITVESPRVRVPIIQPAGRPECTFAITGPTAEAAPQGGTLTLNVATSQNGCRWTIASNASWLQVYPLTGIGSVRVQATVFPNFSLESRTATIAAGSGTLEIRQVGSVGSLNRRIVQQTYFNFFGRLPSEAEIAFHQAHLDEGLPPAGLIERFYATPEFNNGARFIAGLYVGLLARDAEYGGWLFQRNALSAGQVTQNSLVSNFLGSDEWRMKFRSPDDTEYVRILYRNILLREASQGEVDFHVRTLATKAVDRVQIASNFLNSAEFRNGTGPRLTAFLLYATLAARDPLENEFWSAVNSIYAGTAVRTLLDRMTSASDYLRLLQ